MSRQKNKKKRWERTMDAMFAAYGSKKAWRNIKDIDNDNKHAPKGERRA
jgi:hypothetical protein